MNCMRNRDTMCECLKIESFNYLLLKTLFTSYFETKKIQPRQGRASAGKKNKSSIQMIQSAFKLVSSWIPYKQIATTTFAIILV